MKYRPIENYGVIGDLNTVALVRRNGSIDFMCFPNFDWPTIFVALLDNEKEVRFKIEPAFKEMKCKQLYLPDTNVLLTRFLSTDEVGEITDFMPVEELYAGKELIRRVTTVRGHAVYQMRCEPRFNYARAGHDIERKSDMEVLFVSDDEYATTLRLLTSYRYRSIVAAPTFGLPESIGFKRNWDYRYTWIRNA